MTAKVRFFEIKPKANKVLSWVLGLYLFFEALVELGDYIGLAKVSSGPFVYGISRITNSSVGAFLLLTVTTGLLLTIWEMFRRSLAKTKSLLWYVVLAIITLMVCDFLVSLAPDGHESLMDQIQHPSRFDSFASRFKSVSALFQTILQLFLDAALIYKFRGRVRTYAIVSLCCIFLPGLGLLGYSSLANNGVDLYSPVFTSLLMVFRYAIGVLPVIFLRRTMLYQHIKDAGEGGDI